MNREAGNYWVKISAWAQDAWVVAEYTPATDGRGECWSYNGMDSDTDSSMLPSVIHEYRIPNPDEPVVTSKMYLNLQKAFAESGLPLPEPMKIYTREHALRIYGGFSIVSPPIGYEFNQSMKGAKMIFDTFPGNGEIIIKKNN